MLQYSQVLHHDDDENDKKKNRSFGRFSGILVWSRSRVFRGDPRVRYFTLRWSIIDRIPLELSVFSSRVYLRVRKDNAKRFCHSPFSLSLSDMMSICEAYQAGLPAGRQKINLVIQLTFLNHRLTQKVTCRISAQLEAGKEIEKKREERVLRPFSYVHLLKELNYFYRIPLSMNEGISCPFLFSTTVQ